MTELTQERFDEITKDFKRTILHNDGFYRHIQYGNFDRMESCRWEVVTWPEGITISGDYGCAFTLKRWGSKDMLSFFNTSRPNFGYWAEKLISGREQCEDFDPDTLQWQIFELLDEQEIPDGVKHKIAKAFREELEHYGSAAVYHLEDANIDMSDLSINPDDIHMNISRLSSICNDWWQVVDGLTWTWDWRYACFALMKTANDWWATPPAATPRIQMRQFGNNNTQIGAVDTLTIGGKTRKGINNG